MPLQKGCVFFPVRICDIFLMTRCEMSNTCSLLRLPLQPVLQLKEEWLPKLPMTSVIYIFEKRTNAVIRMMWCLCTQKCLLFLPGKCPGYRNRILFPKMSCNAWTTSTIICMKKLPFRNLQNI